MNEAEIVKYLGRVSFIKTASICGQDASINRVRQDSLTPVVVDYV